MNIGVCHITYMYVCGRVSNYHHQRDAASIYLSIYDMMCIRHSYNESRPFPHLDHRSVIYHVRFHNTFTFSGPLSHGCISSML